jgi:hypothetical protein
MITVELSDVDASAVKKASVEIYCSAAGVDFLLRQLELLKKGSSHVHLHTPAWAGDELSEKIQGEGNVLINHLRITLAPPGWETAQKREP